jgi:NADH-quinone oxidoreductase subunit H
MMTCLKYLLPISCVLLVGVCGWQLFVPGWMAGVVAKILAGGPLFCVLAVGVSLFRSAGTASAPAGAMPGAWDGHPVASPVSAK